MNQTFSLEQLDRIFSFHSASGKNVSFSGSVMAQPFFLNSIDAPDTSLPHIYAGGSITYTAPVTYSMEASPYHLLFCITEGAGSFQVNDAEFSVAEDSVFLLGPQMPLSFQTSKTPFTFQLYFLGGTALLSYSRQLFSAHPECMAYAFSDSSSVGYIRTCMDQADHLLASSDPDNVFYIAKFLTDILTECIHLCSAKQTFHTTLPKHVAQMKNLFDSEYEKNHSLDDLEALLGISKYRLCHDFSHYMEISPLQYLNSVRICKAKELLQNPDLTIHEIGSLVGIPNTNHFIRLFQKAIGTTPLKYRQNLEHFLY